MLTTSAFLALASAPNRTASDMPPMRNSNAACARSRPSAMSEGSIPPSIGHAHGPI